MDTSIFLQNTGEILFYMWYLIKCSEANSKRGKDTKSIFLKFKVCGKGYTKGDHPKPHKHQVRLKRILQKRENGSILPKDIAIYLFKRSLIQNKKGRLSTIFKLGKYLNQ